jgi:predicted DNA-binding antitoxin AbrB/MazE fold protein
MAIQVDAVYEDGVLKPVRPLDLAEHERVVVVIREARDQSNDDATQKAAFLENFRKEIDMTVPVLSLEEVRKILSKVPGSLSQEIIASRGER